MLAQFGTIKVSILRLDQNTRFSTNTMSELHCRQGVRFHWAKDRRRRASFPRSVHAHGRLTSLTSSARFFEKACNGMVPEKQMCVSFILEEGEKGPTAKDVRAEDPDRVARVTAQVHYGTVAVRSSHALK